MGCPTGLSSVKQRRYRHLCVCVSPPFSSSICCYALSFLFIYLPSFLYIRLTHSLVWANTHKQFRIHKVISLWVLSSYGLNLISVYWAASPEYPHLPGGTQSQLFVWLHTSNSPIPLSLSSYCPPPPLSTHLFSQYFNPPTTPWVYTHTHTRSLQMV